MGERLVKWPKRVKMPVIIVKQKDDFNSPVSINLNLPKSAFFEGVGHFECKFQMEGASPTKHSWCQKTGVIAVSCGIKILAVHYLVLSQSTRVSDRQTNR